jgi:hypothetical protein
MRGKSLTAMLGVVVLATVTGCSSAKVGNPSPQPRQTSSGTASASLTASPAAVRQPLVAFYQTTPHAVFSAVPAGAKLTALDTAASTKNGLTLYLGFEIDGGKCGTYDVVLEPSHSDMGVGVIHLPGSGQQCPTPTQVTQVLLVVNIPTSLGLRLVVDLSNGKPVVAIAD